MKSKLNTLLLISFLMAAGLTIWLYSLTSKRVGDITYNKNIDDVEFIICNKKSIEQYYSIGTHYQGGKKTIKKELKELINNLKFKESGFITFRFIVNCKHKTGRFRVKTVNSELKENKFESKNIKQIQESIKSLNGWVSGKSKDKYLDSYYLLTFKIENGKIIDIL